MDCGHCGVRLSELLAPLRQASVQPGGPGNEQSKLESPDHAQRMLRRKVAKNGRQQYEWILALVPQHLPQDDKDEIVGLVVEAYKRRTFRKKPFGIRRTKERMKEFVSEFYRQNPTHAYGSVNSPWSLDAPLTHDSSTRLIETVSEGLW